MPSKRHAKDNSVADERRSATTSCAGVAWDGRNLAPALPLPLGWWSAARAAAASRGSAPGAIPARGLRARRNRRVMPGTERGDRRRSDPGLPRFRGRSAGGQSPGERAGSVVFRFARVLRALTGRRHRNRQPVVARRSRRGRALSEDLPGQPHRGGRGGVAGRQRGGPCAPGDPWHDPLAHSGPFRGRAIRGRLGNAGTGAREPAALHHAAFGRGGGDEAGRLRRRVLDAGPAQGARRTLHRGARRRRWRPSSGCRPAGFRRSRPALQAAPRGACARGSRRRRGGHYEVARVARTAPAGSRPRPRRGGRSTQPGDGAHANIRARASERWIPDPVAEVARFIAAERKRRGLPPLQRDPALDGVADQEVRVTAEADQMKLDRALAGRALQRTEGLSSAVAELYVASAPEEVGSSKNLSERKWTRIGVGALYASSRHYGAGRLWVLLLYGR